MQISGTPVADLKMLQDLQTNTKRGSRRTEHAPRKRKRKRQRRKREEEEEEELLPSLEAGIPEAVTPLVATLATIPQVRIDGPPDSNPRPTPRREPALPSLGTSRSLPQLGQTLTTTTIGGGVDQARGARSLAPTTSVSPAKRSLRATTSAASVLLGVGGGGGGGGGGGTAETSGRPAKRRRLETLSVLPPPLAPLSLEKLSTDPYSRARC